MTDAPARPPLPPPATTSRVAGRARPAVPRIPAHVAVLFGVSAGTYAVFLAGSTALQAAADAALAGEKAPIVDALAALSADQDRLAASLEEARARYGEASAAYESLVAQVAAYEARVAELNGRVDRLQAEAGTLPTSIAAPTPGPTTAPIRTTTSSSTTRTTTTSVAAAPLVTPAPKPVATAVTGASVKK